MAGSPCSSVTLVIDKKKRTTEGTEEHRERERALIAES